MKTPQFLVALAVKILTKALREDKDLYQSYQANIAVQFQDQISDLNPYRTVMNLNVHSISNKAARRFLDLWIDQRKGFSK